MGERAQLGIPICDTYGAPLSSAPDRFGADVG